jgi:uncharacterized protein (DUF488 family)
VTIYTVGHSTRSLEDLGEMLRAHGVAQLADVRTVPRSRRHPHFAGDALARSLADIGIAYRHVPALGGLRKPRSDSQNTAWRVEGFRGFADYMETSEFERALEELIAWVAAGNAAGAGSTTVMCAEAVWWRCHRRLIADALVVRGVEVRHISSKTSAPVHTLTPFARPTDQRLAYVGR